jgi:uncharacterized protein YjbK
MQRKHYNHAKRYETPSSLTCDILQIYQIQMANCSVFAALTQIARGNQDGPINGVAESARQFNDA